jgi:tetrahydromethanopterin S-methyltransferase subunit C
MIFVTYNLNFPYNHEMGVIRVQVLAWSIKFWLYYRSTIRDEYSIIVFTDTIYQ